VAGADYEDARKAAWTAALIPQIGLIRSLRFSIRSC